MTGVSRRWFLGLGPRQPAAPPQAAAPAPRSFLEDFYAKRGRQAEVPLVFHPTVATQERPTPFDDEEHDDQD